ncbi:DUF6443 domain-containing protein, partial [Pedobacter sp. L105]|uniref:DUF6443 domain-containing protein n=1 Tax=Pedobacter sp. L105 TaxID=1641871 RepID=UPI0020B14FCE
MTLKEYLLLSYLRTAALFFKSIYLVIIGLLLLVIQVKAQSADTTSSVKAKGLVTNVAAALPGRPGNVTGPTVIPKGTATSTYTVTASSGATSYNWTISPTSAGTITQSGATATVHWTATYTGSVNINCSAVNSSGSTDAVGLTASVVPPTTTIYPGAISPATQTVNYNSIVGTLTSAVATGGNGTFAYQWESSPNSSTWTPISGATGLTCSLTVLGSTMYYHVVVTSGGLTATSGVATVNVLTPVAGGSINPSTQSINYNTTATLTAAAATGGGGNYTYQWTSGTDGINFTNITGATSLSYTSAALTANTYFRLISSSGSSTGTSSAYVTVYPLLVSGSITPVSQTINNGATAATLTASAATGGSGVYSYQWQILSGGTWSNISGATALSYAPGALSATSSYHLISTSNGVNVTSGTATVSIYPPVVAGTVSPVTQSINYGTAGTAIASAAATGGNGIYTYQWQSSPDASNWSSISGANALSYSPPAQTSVAYYHLISTSNGISTTGATATVNVYPLLTTGTVTGAQTINNGSTAVVINGTAATGGNGTYTYQWQQSVGGGAMTNISGAQTLICSPGALTTTTAYQLISTSNGVSVVSNVITISVYSVLVSGTISANQAINNNATATLTGNTPTGGSGVYSYQWQSSVGANPFANISGATGISYTTPTLTTTTSYHLVSTSNGVSVTSATSTVTVYPQLVPGTVTPSLQNVNYNTSGVVITSLAATGGNGIYSYQWQISSDGTNWNNISGAMSLTTSSASLTANTYYHLISTSNGVSVTGPTSVINVYTPLTAGVISPMYPNINYNTGITLTATAPTGGGGVYTYQWTSGTDGMNFSNILGANALVYATPLLTTTTYYRLVSSTSSTVNVISSATVNVYPLLVSGTVSSTSQNINYGATAGAITSTTPTGGTGTYTYQWQSLVSSTWTNVAGANAITFSPGALTATASYHLVASSNGVSVTSNTVPITVYPQLVAGALTTGSQTINYGTIPAILTAVVPTGGNGTYSYQWQSLIGSTWTNISGANAITYSTAALTASTSYRLVFTSNGVSVNSTTAIITVYPKFFAGAITPGNQTINYGTTPAVLVSALPIGGSGTYAYQWQSLVSGVWTNISGATVISYAPAALTATTSYRLISTSNEVIVNSATVIITVYPQLVYGAVSGNQTIVAGATATQLTAVPPTGGNGSYTYQWQSYVVGGAAVNISGATSLTYSPGAVAVTTGYHVVFTSNGVSVTSNSVTITVTAAPPLVAGAISPSSYSILPGSSPGTLSPGSPTGGSGIYTYQWRNSPDGSTWASVTTAGTSLTYMVPNLQTTTYYQLQVSSNSVVATTNTVMVTVTDCPVYATAATASQNYIMTYTPKNAGYSATATGYSPCDVMETLQYMDGIGRRLQLVQVKGSPLKKDIVQPFAYDAFGRETTKFLSYAYQGTSDGSYKADALGTGTTSQSGFYKSPQTPTGVTSMLSPYSVTALEASPLNRLTEQGASGDAWQLTGTTGLTVTAGHTIRVAYTSNNLTAFTDTANSRMAVLYKAVNNAGVLALKIGNGTSNYYNTGQLSVTVTRNENLSATGRGGTTEEYKNMEGQVVLQRTFNYTASSAILQMLSTYYVYDDLGNIAFVLPPGANPDGGSVT